MSEATAVFDAEVLKEVIGELAAKVQPLAGQKDLEGLENLTAVDGSLLPALPEMAWALWMNETNRAAKMHLVFEVMRGIPRKVSMTEGNASEAKQLRDLRFYFSGWADEGELLAHIDSLKKHDA